MGYPPVGSILVNVTTYNWDAVRKYVLFWPFIRDLASGNFSIQYIHSVAASATTTTAIAEWLCGYAEVLDMNRFSM